MPAAAGAGPGLQTSRGFRPACCLLRVDTRFVEAQMQQTRTRKDQPGLIKSTSSGSTAERAFVGRFGTGSHGSGGTARSRRPCKCSQATSNSGISDMCHMCLLHHVFCLLQEMVGELHSALPRWSLQPTSATVWPQACQINVGCREVLRLQTLSLHWFAQVLPPASVDVSWVRG